jgi:hypothetical protein
MERPGTSRVTRDGPRSKSSRRVSITQPDAAALRWMRRAYTRRRALPSLSEHPIGANSIPAHFNFPGVPVRLAPTIVEVELNDEDVFDDDKARRDAISSFENIFVFSRQTRCSWSVDGTGCRERDQEQSRRSAVTWTASQWRGDIRVNKAAFWMLVGKLRKAYCSSGARPGPWAGPAWPR